MQSPASKIAREFIRDQMDIMRKHGKAPKLNAEKMKKLLADTEASFAALRNVPTSKRHA